MMSSREWNFNVRCATLPGEMVCVTGSCPQLGVWKPDKVVTMRKVREDDDKLSEAEKDKGMKGAIWSCDVTLPCVLNDDVTFRYCVCLFVTASDGEQKMVVRRWETSLRPRIIGFYDEPDSNLVHDFGVAALPSNITQCPVQTGWLSQDTLVELKLYEKAITIWKKKHLGKDFYVKVTPVDVAMANQSFSMDLDESLDICETRAKDKSWPIVNVAKLTSEERCFRPQKQFGILFREDEFISFQAQVFDLQSVAFLVDVFARVRLEHPDGRHHEDTEPAEHIGSCYVLPNHFKSTEGRVEAPIVSKRFQPIGQFCAAYLIVTPLKDVQCDLEVTFAKYWKSAWTGLDVGHRGLGDSYTAAQYCSDVRENTIASLKNAYSHGADIVEFDVQVSKDLVPVIYHNFELITSIQKKKGDQKMMVKMPLKNLTLEELHNLKIHHVEELSHGVKEFQSDPNHDDGDHEPFPTLEHALNVIDPHCGFNIEIKWDMELKDGSRESHNAFEMNMYIDIILKTVLEHSASRKIFFSTFNPDICTVLRSKQNKYPVLFLTQGKNTKYVDYRDPRTWSIAAASHFVDMAEILGINAIAEDILRDPKQLDLTKERRQVVFCWTDDKNDKGTVDYLKKLGLQGIVYDRMDINNSKEVKESVFLVEQRRATLEKLNSSPSSSSQGSATPPKEVVTSEGEDLPIIPTTTPHNFSVPLTI